ncbi:MAG: RNA-binding protein [Ignavibacteriae bacterium]|nr:RNA-binding protein [Ignavibacteria bacterium]MBI3364538.1 RNA-binding protein [Ignavibacteriota bacterium]
MRLYVGNLSRDVNEDDLRETFQAFGKVDEVVIVKDKFNSVPKGFGFVEMPDQTEAQKAIDELSGKELKGRSIDVNEARPKTDRPRGGGGGGGGWGGGRSGGGGRGGRSGGGGGGGGRRW